MLTVRSTGGTVVGLTVLVLLPTCRPSTIFETIITVVVDPVYGVTWRRPQPHVFLEDMKTVSPFLTNSDTPCTIVFIIFTLSIVTPLLHCVPGAIQAYLIIVFRHNCLPQKNKKRQGDARLKQSPRAFRLPPPLALNNCLQIKNAITEAPVLNLVQPY